MQNIKKSPLKGDYFVVKGDEVVEASRDACRSACQEFSDMLKASQSKDLIIRTSSYAAEPNWALFAGTILYGASSGKVMAAAAALPSLTKLIPTYAHWAEKAMSIYTHWIEGATMNLFDDFYIPQDG